MVDEFVENIDLKKNEKPEVKPEGQKTEKKEDSKPLKADFDKYANLYVDFVSEKIEENKGKGLNGMEKSLYNMATTEFLKKRCTPDIIKHAPDIAFVAMSACLLPQMLPPEMLDFFKKKPKQQAQILQFNAEIQPDGSNSPEE